MSRLGTAALSYAARGWRVLPAQPRGKNPGALLGKDWQSKATTDRAVIERWWERWPEANVAILLGADLAVLDLDRGAEQRVRELLGALAPPTPTVKSGSGWHLYFKPPPDGVAPVRFGQPGDPDLELRGGNQIVIAPPSVHPSGATYAWLRERAPHAVRLAGLPGRLLAARAST